MRRGPLLLVALLALGAVLIVRSFDRVPDSRPVQAHITSEEPPVCPWRDPSRDLATFFPNATGFKTETRILSAMMAPIRKELGRMMTLDENPLRLFRAQRDDNTIGSVLVCRTKGEHGGIELVIAVETNGTIRAVSVQSQREPPSVARGITNSTWLAAFSGKDHRSAFRVGEDLPAVPSVARASGQAIGDGVRSQLIVLSFAEQLDDTPSRERMHHNH